MVQVLALRKQLAGYTTTERYRSGEATLGVQEGVKITPGPRLEAASRRPWEQGCGQGAGGSQGEDEGAGCGAAKGGETQSWS